MKYVCLILFVLLVQWPARAQGLECASGEVATRDAYQYGRFETRMQSVQGNGVVGSFFLYNLDVGCNWPAENNEIDIEMTGNLDASVQFTTHYPGPWYVTQIVPTAFNPHSGLHDYAIEWEPGVVRWFVDGDLVYTQDSLFVDGLMYPMRIMMNLWGVDSPDWAGSWDPEVMPAKSVYDYVRYFAYSPGSGDAGTGNNYTLEWVDEFDTLDTSRWEVTEFGGFGGNFCSFVSNNVSASEGKLELDMTSPLTSTSSPVTFSVDVTALALPPSDVIYLNGTFNNWCGGCNAMSDEDGDGIWELSLSLAAGKHEFLFSRNVWDEIGGAPLGSSCDFAPCDGYGNYGLVVPFGASTMETETYCWGSCESCAEAEIDNCPVFVFGDFDVGNKRQCDLVSIIDSQLGNLHP